MPQCQTCGKEIGYYQGRARLYCPALPGEGISKCLRKKKRPPRPNRVYIKRTAEKEREKIARIRADPKRLEEYNRRFRKYERQRNAHKKRIGRERYEMVNAAVPKHFTRDNRMEVVAEACLFYAEGYHLEKAVTMAIKKVNKGNELQNWKSKDINDCFWLADESESAEEEW